jgi:hypothetical protein
MIRTSGGYHSGYGQGRRGNEVADRPPSYSAGPGRCVFLVEAEWEGLAFRSIRPDGGAPLDFSAEFFRRELLRLGAEEPGGAARTGGEVLVGFLNEAIPFAESSEARPDTVEVDGRLYRTVAVAMSFDWSRVDDPHGRRLLRATRPG